MTLDTLKADLQQNLADVAKLATEVSATPDTSAKIDLLMGHLRNSLWPTLEAVVDELGEVDECVADIISNAEDILQPDTAATFSAVIAGATAVAAALKVRITPESDPALYRVVGELEKNLAEATEIMKEIVIDDGEPLDGEDDEDDEDDEDEDGEDD